MTITSSRRSVLSSLADRLVRAWNEGDVIDPPAPEVFPANRSEAYVVQDMMAAALEDLTIGWKIGASSVEMQKREGHDGIIAGRLFKSRACFEPDGLLDAGIFGGARIEAEFALRLLQDLPAGAAKLPRNALLDRVAFHPAIEVIGNRYPKNGTFKGGTLPAIADNGGGVGIVVGAEVAGWQDVDFLLHPISLQINDTDVGQNLASELRADPIEALRDLCDQLDQRDITLKAGDIVSTGGSTVPVPIAPGDRIIADFGSLGSVRFSLKAL
ncbi:hypothetical protein OEG84_12440 [Hoeflea sp. G2-23]|uniref:Hydratase n=1 Tax=Hoeflea algicola TaxID=2983763 RepID=A0ABT3Z9Z9_9HYPH|nr:hypothetical protein [Hoeflea algicola]MCY0148501.1 hypothetical protein [Hoeflea algicola]